MNALKNFPAAKALLLGVGLVMAQWQPTLAQVPTDQRQATTTTQEQPLLSTLASYRDDVRRAALLASQHPQVLNQLQQQQANSQQSFIDLVQSYGQTKQGWFYDIARYPDVMHALATLPKGTDRAQVDALTKALPADLQETAWRLYRHHHDDLMQADNLSQQADQAFANLIAPLDQPTQAAFRQLLNTPDVLTTLTQQLDKTTELGSQYQADPDGMSQRLTALHDSLTAQNERDLAQYQQELNQDPEARQELQQASKEYARANGINPNPAWPNNPTIVYNNPYPYWFGYPYWYGSPMWYPSAFGYGTGFYYGLGGNMIVYGLPSFGFSNWFFNYGYGSYPYLYNRFNNYYAHTYGPRRIVPYTNPGFWGPASRAFSPTTGIGRARTYGAPFQQRGTFAPNARTTLPSTRSYNGSFQPRSYGGGFQSRSFGSGFGSSRGFGGGFGGGFHGGGRR